MLIFAFGAAFLALLLQSALFFPFTILPFAPYVVLVLLRSSLPKTLWLAALAGAVIDLISDDPLGLHALNYTLTSAFLYRHRKHFFYDNPFHFSLFSTCFSFISTLLQLLLLFLFDRRIPFAGKWIFGDLLGMPFIDGIYALIWFAGPLVLITKFRRQGSLYWNAIKQSLFPTSL